MHNVNAPSDPVIISRVFQAAYCGARALIANQFPCGRMAALSMAKRLRCHRNLYLLPRGSLKSYNPSHLGMSYDLPSTVKIKTRGLLLETVSGPEFRMAKARGKNAWKPMEIHTDDDAAEGDLGMVYGVLASSTINR